MTSEFCLQFMTIFGYGTCKFTTTSYCYSFMMTEVTLIFPREVVFVFYSTILLTGD